MKSKLLGAAVLLLGLSLAGAGTSMQGETAEAAAPQRPNVIVINSDDQSLETIRVMDKTLSLLASQGTTFDNNFVANPLCCPSRATFLTGQYSHNNGVLTNSLPNGGYQKLDHSSTLALWLQRAGYTTAQVGKYLNGYGRFGSGGEIPPGWNEWHAGVKLSFFDWTMNSQGALVAFGSRPADYQTDVLTRKAVEVINRRIPQSKPLFMWLNYYAPHAGGPREPDDPPGLGTVNVGPRYRDRFAGEPLPDMPSFNEADVSDKPIGIRNRPPLSPRRIAGIEEAYQQQLESLLSIDDGVAAVVNALAARGELGNTLIVYTTDNGFFHGEHRVAAGKTLVYEPAVRVNLLMRGPGVPRGLRLKQLVSNVDLAPTIVDVADAKAGLRMDGRSLLPVLRNPSLQWGRDLLIERGPGNGHYVALRTPRYKYVEYNNGERELYDLARDPDELTSLASDPSLAALRAELARRLAVLRTCKGSACRVGPRVALRQTRCRVLVTGADRRWVSAVSRSRTGRTVTARISFADGRIVLRSAKLARACS